MKQKIQKPYKIGLALSGGGAKGFAHLGVFRLLEECGIKPDIISGTSAGAIAGALFSDGYTSEEIEDLFKGREFSKFASLQLPRSGIFDNKRLRSFLKKYLRTKNIEDMPIPLVVVATDIDQGKSYEFRSGSLVEALVASSSIPILFSPVEIDGSHYVDGGLFRNFPVTTIREECEKIIGVNVTPLVRQKYKQTIWHIAERSYHYMFRANTLEDRDLCDLLIETDTIGQYNMFDLDNVSQIVQLGYNAALEAFDELIQDSKFHRLVHAVKLKRQKDTIAIQGKVD